MHRMFLPSVCLKIRSSQKTSWGNINITYIAYIKSHKRREATKHQNILKTWQNWYLQNKSQHKKDQCWCAKEPKQRGGMCVIAGKIQWEGTSLTFDLGVSQWICLEPLGPTERNVVALLSAPHPLLWLCVGAHLHCVHASPAWPHGRPRSVVFSLSKCGLL